MVKSLRIAVLKRRYNSLMQVHTLNKFQLSVRPLHVDMRQLLPGRDLGHGMLLELLGTQGRFNVEMLGQPLTFVLISEPQIRSPKEEIRTFWANVLNSTDNEISASLCCSISITPDDRDHRGREYRAVELAVPRLVARMKGTFPFWLLGR